MWIGNHSGSSLMARQRQRRESSRSQPQQCGSFVAKDERHVLISLNMTVFVWLPRLVALRSDDRWISSNLLPRPFS